MWNDKSDGYRYDTHLKPDQYGYEYEFLPVGTCTSINFYPQPIYWRTSNCSIGPELNPLQSLSGNMTLVSLASQKKERSRRRASGDSRLYRSAAIAPCPSSDERFAVLAATCPSPTRWRALLQTDTGVPLPWFCFVCSRLVLCYANLPEQGTSIVPSAWILCYAPNNIDGAKQLPLKRRILSEWTTTIWDKAFSHRIQEEGASRVQANNQEKINFLLP
jgi:hypothetical protein